MTTCKKTPKKRVQTSITLPDGTVIHILDINIVDNELIIDAKITPVKPIEYVTFRVKDLIKPVEAEPILTTTNDDFIEAVNKDLFAHITKPIDPHEKGS